MKTTAGKPESKPGPAPGAKSDAQKNLKSIPMAELRTKLGSSPNGLTQADATKRLAQYEPN
jgi:H+-transporting ATPase